MKILIIGSNGQVGSELCSVLPDLLLKWDQQAQVISSNRGDLDLSELVKIHDYLVKVAPNIIVNASAYTAVDKAESQKDLAFSVNEVAVREIALYCKNNACRLVHISTDYVFDGQGEMPFAESAKPEPRSVYGRSKLAGENAIRELVHHHVILRCSWVFGASGNNFVKTMIGLVDSADELNVVADQFGAPTSARAIAQTISAIIYRLVSSPQANQVWGTYHFSGYPFVSWSSFAVEIFEQATGKGLVRVAPRVNAISTVDYPTAASRPANSRLDCSKLKRVFDIEPDDWRRSLGAMLDEIRRVD